jgi:hypothetical protein
MKPFASILLFLLLSSTEARLQTFCNPIDIDYGFTPIPNFSEQGRHRATADPLIVTFKGNYYLFSTNQWGYWVSPDMVSWRFIPHLFLKPWHKVYDELCAPGAVALGDSLLLLGSTYSKNFPIWMSTDPTRDSWREAVDSFEVGAWDPSFFLDDDGRLFIYFGSSNAYPLYAQEIDRKTFKPIGIRKEVLRLNDALHGWERFGEHNDNTFLKPFTEGAWMNKHNGRYYLQYGAPGTEFSGYGDGVYVGDGPLGPFAYQPHNPFSFKPGGFARGAGHGATYQDLHGNWWHISTVVVGVKNNFERRLGIWPAGFDKDGILFCETAYGDFPHYTPDSLKKGRKDPFTGWMILNYNKPVQVSSTLGGYLPNLAVDEDIKTYWSAKTAEKGEWIQSDLGRVSTVQAVQINYADQDADVLGKKPGLYHRYILRGSVDGKTWTVLKDKSRNLTDEPHDYIEFENPVKTRYIRLENVHMASGRFAVSGLRAFGKAEGSVPDTVKRFVVLRGDSERRNAWLKWQTSDDAIGYVIRFGVAPDKMYGSVMVYGRNEYYFRAMDADRVYFFQIESFNESGIGKRTTPVRVE